MTNRNTEFNDIRLKIHIEAKIGEKNKEEQHLRQKIGKNCKRFTNFTRQIHSIRIHVISGNVEFNGEFNDIRLKIQIELKTVEKKEKKTTFARENWQNLSISQEKVHIIRIVIISANAQFNGKFKGIRLKIEIEVKTGEKKRCLQERICKKFPNFTRKNSLNWKSNDNWKWRIQ